MARPSARPKMIEAALSVVREHGVTALTLDSAAEAAGVTKRGLIYHFPSKHALIAGMHEELAARFEQRLIEAAGGAAEGTSLLDRTRAYVRVSLTASMEVELRLILEAVDEPDWLAPWEDVYSRWFPAARPVEAMDELELRCLLARMTADGAWGWDATAEGPLSGPGRELLLERILRTLEDAPAG